MHRQCRKLSQNNHQHDSKLKNLISPIKWARIQLHVLKGINFNVEEGELVANHGFLPVLENLRYEYFGYVR